MTTPILIPQCSPKRSLLSQQPLIKKAINKVIKSGIFIDGPEVASFENEFKDYLNIPYAVGVANGTDAIELALRAVNINKNDLVATVAHSAMGSILGILRIGAIPIFVDIDPETYTMSMESLQHILKKFNIKAVIPVHLYGHPVDIKSLLHLSSKFGFFIIEDCAQSHGAAIGSKKVGTFGHVSAFSFYPTKNLGALGDGGMVVTPHQKTERSIRLLKEYGWKKRYVSEIFGTNSRLDEIQAAILRVKLQKLDKNNLKRISIASSYTKLLMSNSLHLPKTIDNNTHVFHQYVIRLSKRDVLRNKLKQKNILTNIHYPVPLHKQPLMRNIKCFKDNLHVTETVANQVLSLPMFPELKEHEIKKITSTILNYV